MSSNVTRRRSFTDGWGLVMIYVPSLILTFVVAASTVEVGDSLGLKTSCGQAWWPEFSALTSAGIAECQAAGLPRVLIGAALLIIAGVAATAHAYSMLRPRG